MSQQLHVLVDVNLSPSWCVVLLEEGIHAVHWTAVGDPAAPDAEIMRYARERSAVVLTHDLDFGIALALTRDSGPSVVQMRCDCPTVEAVGSLVLIALTAELRQGALVTIEPTRVRARILPFRPM